MLSKSSAAVLPNVLAGIVTFNPDIERLRENIESICNQVLNILIVDNKSENLSAIKSLANEFDVNVIANSENKGLGAALNQILFKAEMQKCDYAYLLDQDSVSSPNLVSVLLNNASDDIAIVSPLIVDRNKPDRIIKTKDSRIYIERPITSGSLVRTCIWHAVGGFDEDLFVEFVDYEFDERCLQAGYKLLQVNDVSLLQEGGHAERSRLISGFQRSKKGRIALKHPYRYGYSPDRLYYRYRNMLVFMRRFDKSMTSLSSTRAYMLKLLIHDLFIEKQSINSIRHICKGLRDGASMPVTLEKDIC